MEEKKIGVGFGVMLIREKRILLGKRNDDPEKASSELHGEGTWTMPGGKLHFGESFEEGCVREVAEETGIRLDKNDLRLISLSNDMAEDAHFVTVGFYAERFSGEAAVMEPDEIVQWKWFNLDNLPRRMYKPSCVVLKHYLDEEVY